MGATPTERSHASYERNREKRKALKDSLKKLSTTELHERIYSLQNAIETKEALISDIHRTMAKYQRMLGMMSEMLMPWTKTGQNACMQNTLQRHSEPETMRILLHNCRHILQGYVDDVSRKQIRQRAAIARRSLSARQHKRSKRGSCHE